MKKIAVSTAVSSLVLGASMAQADSKEPIVIPTHNWTSQITMAYVIGGIFESIGDNVSYVPADSQAVYESVRNGDVTISHEIWQSTFGKSFNNALDAGGIIDVGNHASPTQEEWWYPAYVGELCPGLPSWKALNDCSELFATAGSGGKGRYLDGPMDWHGQETLDRIKALDMDFTAKFAGSSGALWAELESAKKDNRAVVIFNWSPNFTDAGEGGSFVEFPEYTPGCKMSDGGDGKCGSPPAGWLKKAAYYQMPKKWPTAYKVFNNISFTKSDIGNMAALVDIDGLSHEEAAEKWLADNEATWKKWL
ncbi:glycine/betaine ABC transporter substrate-binding protein [Marinomonas ushuaiensis DSM 15871]|uniref:Glycine/betaine ABC transporter substrate-binding protein n=1 Tax=Marinomonas ushuaiensis DSM 15871 TaxID=1122207 RepID=X7E902_9GAMM|nr:glycine/betaine ABC transporter substrate-binding protein [Marinomonas ushuaiensis DSM 15871]